ncbi:MAG: FAD:protein FMN transferase [Propionibacteriaceae bacterium]|nr:FAD:protein FMN transferase [Propionibacteriaceae bacterium]
MVTDMNATTTTLRRHPQRPGAFPATRLAPARTKSTSYRRARAWRRWTAVEQLMGTVFSIQLIRPPEDERERFDRAVANCWDELRDVERRFTPHREMSDLRRIARGELSLARADKRLREVEALSREALERTGGRFDAWRDGWFDPTGLVKAWAVDHVAQRHLYPLLKNLGAAAVGINAGGDMRLFTAPTSAWRWGVGILDPTRDDRRVLATVEIADGAVATSGTAERGARIVDPRTGQPATSVASATVLADTLAEAELWATTAVVAGFDDLTWLDQANVRSGLLVAPDGRVRRWAGAVELDAKAA